MLDGEGYYLEDESKNGTLVDGKLIRKSRCRLKDGAVIEIRGINPETKLEEAAFKAQLRVTIKEVEVKKGLMERFFGS